MNKLFVLLSILYFSNIFGQNSFTKSQTDSILKKHTYNNVEENASYQVIKEIDALLPKVTSDSAVYVLNKQKAYLYGRVGNQSMVLKSHLENKKYIEKSPNYSDHIYYYLALAEVYNNLKMYQLALLNIDKADKIIEKFKTDDLKYYFASISLRQINYFNSSNYDACILLSKKVLSRKKDIENEFLDNFLDMASNQFIARCYLEMKNYNLVLPYLNKSIDLDNKSVYEYQFINNNTLGRYYYETKDIDSSLYALDQFDLTEVSLYPSLLGERYSLYTKIFAAKGDQVKVAFYLNKKDSIDLLLNKTDMKAVEDSMMFSDDENSSKVALKNTIIITITVTALIIITILLLSYFKKRKEKKIFEKIISDLKIENEIKLTGNQLFNFNMLINEDVKLNLVEDTFSTNQKKECTESLSNTSNISEEKEQQLLQQLLKFENGEKFLNPDTSLNSVATLFKTNQTYLSEIINKNKGANFSSYIHQLRINYLLNQLNTDPKLLTYKISYLAEICGYSSYETFTRIFKSIVGLSPSSYINQLKKN